MLFVFLRSIELVTLNSSPGSTALVEACRNRDLGMLDLLLKSHARDDECKALFIAAHAKDEVIVSKLLALKVRDTSSDITLSLFVYKRKSRREECSQ